ncbi:MAG: hypothetical protein ACFFEJ_14320, partial [Candidatus Thorarchaeota archaeon]
TNGSLQVDRVTTSAEILLDPYQLSSIISGISPAILLRELREIQCSKKTAMNLSAIFPEDIFVSYMRF